MRFIKPASLWVNVSDRTIHCVDVNLQVLSWIIHKIIGKQAPGSSFRVFRFRKGLAEVLHHLTFGPDPVIQGTSRPAPLGKPELVRPLLDVCLCPKMLFRGQDNGGGKMRVDQLDGVFVSVLVLRFGPAVESRLKRRLPAYPPLDRVELRLHGRTSTTELREP